MSYTTGVNRPDYASASQLIQHLNLDELKNLSEDDSRMTEMVNDLPQVKQLASEKDMVLASNKSLAEYNLSQEPILIETRERLVNLHNEASAMIEKVNEKKSKLETLRTQASLDTLLAILQTKAAESEEQSESLVDKFLEGEQSIDSFLELYNQIRQTAHLRRIKVEKMQELMTSQSQTNATPRPAPQPPVQATQAPYPISWQSPNVYNVPPQYSSVGMPMPMNNYYR